ncbi:MAG: hypothetical protein JSW08_03360 [archaeon]|nr:MAG: hypothetical protein JSW08_03360 [archaeon]
MSEESSMRVIEEGSADINYLKERKQYYEKVIRRIKNAALVSLVSAGLAGLAAVVFSVVPIIQDAGLSRQYNGGYITEVERDEMQEKGHRTTTQGAFTILGLGILGFGGYVGGMCAVGRYERRWREIVEQIREQQSSG